MTVGKGPLNWEALLSGLPESELRRLRDLLDRKIGQEDVSLETPQTLKASRPSEQRDPGLKHAGMTALKNSDKSSPAPMLYLYTDGASRGNPGLAGTGVLIFDDKGTLLFEEGGFIGVCTNNEAEYRAFMRALEEAAVLTKGPLSCYMDSELLARQLSGRYAVKSEKLLPLFAEIKNRLRAFPAVSFNHVPREHPRLKMADKLANLGIDQHLKKGGSSYGR